MEAQVYNSSTQKIRQEDSKFKGREGRREERLSGEERDGTSLFRTIRKKSGLGTLKKKTKPTSALVLSASIRYRILVYGDEVLWVLGTHSFFHPLLDTGS